MLITWQTLVVPAFNGTEGKQHPWLPPKSLYCCVNQKEQMGFDGCGFTRMEKPTSEQCVHADEVICELFCEFK